MLQLKYVQRLERICVKLRSACKDPFGLALLRAAELLHETCASDLADLRLAAAEAMTSDGYAPEDDTELPLEDYMRIMITWKHPRSLIADARVLSEWQDLSNPETLRAMWSSRAV